MEKYFIIFDEFSHGSPHKFTFAEKDDEFLIYVFCSSDEFYFRVEIGRLNCLAKKFSISEF